ncbi:MAG: YggT family protein [Spirochaetales bacterium]
MVLLNFAAKLIGLYSMLIWVRIILSWIRSPQLQSNEVYIFLCRITDPFLNIFKPKNFVGRIDFSPLFALMILNTVKTVLEMIYTYNKITLWLVLAVLINNLWAYIFRYIFLIVIIMLVVRIFVSRSTTAQSQMWLNVIDRNLNAPVGVVFRLFYSNKQVSDQTLVITSLIFYGAIYIGLKYGIQALTKFLLTL